MQGKIVEKPHFSYEKQEIWSVSTIVIVCGSIALRKAPEHSEKPSMW